MDKSQIASLENQIKRDPKSQAFLPLAEAYRSNKELEKAEAVALQGVKHHPNMMSGIVMLARILKDRKKFPLALEYLKLATEKSPDNILAHLLKGEVYLALKEPKLSLNCFKIVLFHSPSHPQALKAIRRLESVTADEYEDELFAMQRLDHFVEEAKDDSEIRDKQIASSLPPMLDTGTHSSLEQTQGGTHSPISKGLERLLSLTDAFIVRQEIDRALELLRQGAREFSDHPEIHKRLRHLESETRIQEPEEIAPLASREQWVREQKIKKLKSMLTHLQNINFSSSN